MDADNPKKGGEVLKETRIIKGLDEAKAARPGKRNDLESFRRMVVEKKGIIDIMDEEAIREPELKTIARYPNFAASLISRVMGDTERYPPLAFAFTGPTGTGKTHKAWELMRDKLNLRHSEIYQKNPENKWWDGFDPSQHKCVFIDEYRGANPEMWLTILNEKGVPYFVEKKGSTVPITAKYFVFTSPVHPMGWISSWDHQDKGDQWMRRLGPRHKHLEDPYVPPQQEHHPEDDLFKELFA